MKKLLTILLILCVSYSHAQTIADAKPMNGYYVFNDTTKLEKPLLNTSYSTTSTLHFLMGDSVNKGVYNYLSPSAFVTSLGSSFINNQFASAQSSSTAWISGNFRTDAAIGIGATPTGNNGIYLISKNLYQQGHVSDNSEIIADFRGANGGQRVSIYGGGLTTMGYSSAPSQQSNTSLFLNRLFIGNDDAGYLHGTRYNSGTPYFIIQASQSATVAGVAGIQLVASNSGSQKIGLQIESDGRVGGTGLHNNGTVTGTAIEYIASGTYTPTLTNVTNVAASTAYACQWMRVGNVVTVSGKVDIDVTGALATELGLSLPIASAMTAEENLGGTSSSGAAASLVSAIRADATNDRAAFVFTAISLTNDSYFFTFTYLIK